MHAAAMCAPLLIRQQVPHQFSRHCVAGFRLLGFTTNFGIALQSVMAQQASVRVLVTSVFFTVNVLAVGFCWPFRMW